LPAEEGKKIQKQSKILLGSRDRRPRRRPARLPLTMTVCRPGA